MAMGKHFRADDLGQTLLLPRSLHQQCCDRQKQRVSGPLPYGHGAVPSGAQNRERQRAENLSIRSLP